MVNSQRLRRKWTENNITHFGISAALLTPFHADGRLNLPLFSDHARATLDNGANGVTLFGTTGEGPSIAFDERYDAISALIDGGVPSQTMTLGVCGPAIGDVARQVHQGTEFGITKFLLIPPFFFKNLDDEGLFDWHERLFTTADAQAKFIIYHIPQVTQVPISVELAIRLHKTFLDRILAIKDSAGQWENTRELLESEEIPVLVGDERLLHKAAAMGGAGSICGMANLHPQRMRNLFETHREDKALSAEVDVILAGPVIPRLKQAMVAKSGEESWRFVRPPLQVLQGDVQAAIKATLS